MDKIVALAADYQFLDKAETTIKSILWHNPKVIIYLLNYDIPQEWFINVNQYVNQFGSMIVDEKFNSGLVNQEKTSWKHINQLAYARFLIPNLIKEDKVLYLDSDVVVVSSLASLFQTAFDGKSILAVKDYSNFDQYNSGVMLLNNKLLKNDPDLAKKLLVLGQKRNLKNGDQVIINHYFQNQIGSLPLNYNYQIGWDYFAHFFNKEEIIALFEKVKNPKIIHYSTNDKPYNFLSRGRLRQTWWFYHNLNWPEIVQKYTIYDARKIGPQQFRSTAFIFTDSDQIAHLSELVKALPEVCFNIAASTEMSEVLTNFVHFPNVRLYKDVIPPILKQLINSADTYLDINFGSKDKNVLDQLKAKQVPILAFGQTADQNNSYDQYQVFADEDVAGMVNKIKQIMQTK